MRRSTLSVALAVILILVIAFTTACQQPVAVTKPGEGAAGGSADKAAAFKWKMASSWPKGTYLQWSSDEFAKRVGEMSGGRLTIESHPGGAIIGALEVFDAVNAGSIDAASTWAGYWIGKEPSSPLFAATPAGMEALEFLSWVYEGGGLALWQEMYQKYNFGYVATAGSIGPEIFAWSHKPLRTLDDFKGLKFRTVGFWGEILNEMGVSVATVPGAEVYPSLERKVIDAAEYSLPNIDTDLGFHEIAKYMHVPGLHQPSSLMEMIVNKKSWDSLPKDLQEIVKSAGYEVTLRGLMRGIALDVQAFDKIKAQGTEVVKLSPEVQLEVRKRADALYDKKAAGDPFFKKVVDSQRAWRTKYAQWDDLMTPKY